MGLDMFPVLAQSLIPWAFCSRGRVTEVSQQCWKERQRGRKKKGREIEIDFSDADLDF